MKPGNLMTIKGEAGIWRVISIDFDRKECHLQKLGEAWCERRKTAPLADLRPAPSDLEDFPAAS